MSNQLAGAGDQSTDPVKDPADRSILIGIVATLLFHVLLVVLSPQFSFAKFSGVHTGITVNHENRGKTFDFELTPPPPRELEKPPSEFVETNPDAPENEPDKTANFSNRNQQSAQKEVAKVIDPENRPAVKGQEKIKADAVVTGDMTKPQLGAAPRPPSKQEDQQEQKEEQLRMEKAPDAGYAKNEGKSEEGIATNISQSKITSTHADEATEGVHDAKDPNGAAMVAVIDAHKTPPKSRPRLTSTALPSVVTTREAGARQAGIVGRDARWSEYGAYLAELEEIICQQWYNILEESRVSPPHGSHVVITFKINSKGETDIIKVEDADAGKQGVFSCQSAIQARQPYRAWSEQMIAVLGDEQELTFSFYYL